MAQRLYPEPSEFNCLFEFREFISSSDQPVTHIKRQNKGLGVGIFG